MVTVAVISSCWQWMGAVGVVDGYGDKIRRGELVCLGGLKLIIWNIVLLMLWYIIEMSSIKAI